MANSTNNFPWFPDGAPVYHNPFRKNVLDFLGAYGNLVPLKLQLTKAWIVPLQRKTGVVKLHVYEEHLDETPGAPAICDQCRNMGWQHHPVSNRRYHFILPSPAVLSDPDQLPSLVEAAAAGRVDPTKAAVSNLAVEAHGPDPCDSSYNAPASIFDSTTHCLHGLIHGNGYGHLLRVNGRDGAAATAAAMAAAAQEEGSGGAGAATTSAVAGGSAVSLAGPELMSLWDAMCTILRAREVSVEDVSNKSSMLLRLLYSAAHMRTWYGKWGYVFGRAAFNYGSEEYGAAVRAVHSVPVVELLRDVEGVDATAHKILRTYWLLPPSLPHDATFGQVLQRMLFFITRPDVLKEARVQQIAAAKATAASKFVGASPGAAPEAAAGAAAPANLLLPPPAGVTGRKTPKTGGKAPLYVAGLPPAKRTRKSFTNEEPGSTVADGRGPAAMAEQQGTADGLLLHTASAATPGMEDIPGTLTACGQGEAFGFRCSGGGGSGSGRSTPGLHHPPTGGVPQAGGMDTDQLAAPPVLSTALPAPNDVMHHSRAALGGVGGDGSVGGMQGGGAAPGAHGTFGLMPGSSSQAAPTSLTMGASSLAACATGSTAAAASDGPPASALCSAPAAVAAPGAASTPAVQPVVTGPPPSRPAFPASWQALLWPHLSGAAPGTGAYPATALGPQGFGLTGAPGTQLTSVMSTAALAAAAAAAAAAMAALLGRTPGALHPAGTNPGCMPFLSNVNSGGLFQQQSQHPQQLPLQAHHSLQNGFMPGVLPFPQQQQLQRPGGLTQPLFPHGALLPVPPHKGLQAAVSSLQRPALLPPPSVPGSLPQPQQLPGLTAPQLQPQQQPSASQLPGPSSLLDVTQLLLLHSATNAHQQQQQQQHPHPIHQQQQQPGEHSYLQHHPQQHEQQQQQQPSQAGPPPLAHPPTAPQTQAPSFIPMSGNSTAAPCALLPPATEQSPLGSSLPPPPPLFTSPMLPTGPPHRIPGTPPAPGESAAQPVKQGPHGHAQQATTLPSGLLPSHSICSNSGFPTSSAPLLFSTAFAPCPALPSGLQMFQTPHTHMPSSHAEVQPLGSQAQGQLTQLQLQGPSAPSQLATSGLTTAQYNSQLQPALPIPQQVQSQSQPVGCPSLSTLSELSQPQSARSQAHHPPPLLPTSLPAEALAALQHLTQMQTAPQSGLDGGVAAESPPPSVTLTQVTQPLLSPAPFSAMPQGAMAEGAQQQQQPQLQQQHLQHTLRHFSSQEGPQVPQLQSQGVGFTPLQQQQEQQRHQLELPPPPQQQQQGQLADSKNATQGQGNAAGGSTQQTLVAYDDWLPLPLPPPAFPLPLPQQQEQQQQSAVQEPSWTAPLQGQLPEMVTLQPDGYGPSCSDACNAAAAGVGPGPLSQQPQQQPASLILLQPQNSFPSTDARPTAPSPPPDPALPDTPVPQPQGSPSATTLPPLAADRGPESSPVEPHPHRASCPDHPPVGSAFAGCGGAGLAAASFGTGLAAAALEPPCPGGPAVLGGCMEAAEEGHGGEGVKTAVGWEAGIEEQGLATQAAEGCGQEQGEVEGGSELESSEALERSSKRRKPNTPKGGLQLEQAHAAGEWDTTGGPGGAGASAEMGAEAGALEGQWQQQQRCVGDGSTEDLPGASAAADVALSTTGAGRVGAMGTSEAALKASALDCAAAPAAVSSAAATTAAALVQGYGAAQDQASGGNWQRDRHLDVLGERGTAGLDMDKCSTADAAQPPAGLLSSSPSPADHNMSPATDGNVMPQLSPDMLPDQALSPVTAAPASRTDRAGQPIMVAEGMPGALPLPCLATLPEAAAAGAAAAVDASWSADTADVTSIPGRSSASTWLTGAALAASPSACAAPTDLTLSSHSTIAAVTTNITSANTDMTTVVTATAANMTATAGLLGVGVGGGASFQSNSTPVAMAMEDSTEYAGAPASATAAAGAIGGNTAPAPLVADWLQRDPCVSLSAASSLGAEAAAAGVTAVAAATAPGLADSPAEDSSFPDLMVTDMPDTIPVDLADTAAANFVPACNEVPAQLNEDTVGEPTTTPSSAPLPVHAELVAVSTAAAMALSGGILGEASCSGKGTADGVAATAAALTSVLQTPCEGPAEGTAGHVYGITGEGGAEPEQEAPLQEAPLAGQIPAVCDGGSSGSGEAPAAAGASTELVQTPTEVGHGCPAADGGHAGELTSPAPAGAGDNAPSKPLLESSMQAAGEGADLALGATPLGADTAAATADPNTSATSTSTGITTESAAAAAFDASAPAVCVDHVPPAADVIARASDTTTAPISILAPNEDVTLCAAAAAEGPAEDGTGVPNTHMQTLTPPEVAPSPPIPSPANSEQQQQLLLEHDPNAEEAATHHAAILPTAAPTSNSHIIIAPATSTGTAGPVPSSVAGPPVDLGPPIEPHEEPVGQPTVQSADAELPTDEAGGCRDGAARVVAADTDFAGSCGVPDGPLLPVAPGVAGRSVPVMESGSSPVGTEEPETHVDGVVKEGSVRDEEGRAPGDTGADGYGGDTLVAVVTSSAQCPVSNLDTAATGTAAAQNAGVDACAAGLSATDDEGGCGSAGGDGCGGTAHAALVTAATVGADGTCCDGGGGDGEAAGGHEEDGHEVGGPDGNRGTDGGSRVGEEPGTAGAEAGAGAVAGADGAAAGDAGAARDAGGGDAAASGGDVIRGANSDTLEAPVPSGRVGNDGDAGGSSGGAGAGVPSGGRAGRNRYPGRAVSGAHIGPAPEDLPRVPVGELEKLHAIPEPDMHLRDCQRAMDAMLQALQSHCCRQWLARLQLRDVMMETYRDYKLLDWVLKQVANVRIGGYAVFRSKYTVTRSYYYRLEPLPDTPPDAPLAYTVPVPEHGPHARKPHRTAKPPARSTSAATVSAAGIGPTPPHASTSAADGEPLAAGGPAGADGPISTGPGSGSAERRNAVPAASAVGRSSRATAAGAGGAASSLAQAQCDPAEVEEGAVAAAAAVDAAEERRRSGAAAGTSGSGAAGGSAARGAAAAGVPGKATQDKGRQGKSGGPQALRVRATAAAVRTAAKPKARAVTPKAAVAAASAAGAVSPTAPAKEPRTATTTLLAAPTYSGTGAEAVAVSSPATPAPDAAAAAAGGGGGGPRSATASWREHAKEHQSEGQALLDSVLESRIEHLPGAGVGTGSAPARVPRELRYLMSQATLSKLKLQQKQGQRQAQAAAGAGPGSAGGEPAASARELQQAGVESGMGGGGDAAWKDVKVEEVVEGELVGGGGTRDAAPRSLGHELVKGTRFGAGGAGRELARQVTADSKRPLVKGETSSQEKKSSGRLKATVAVACGDGCDEAFVAPVDGVHEGRDGVATDCMAAVDDAVAVGNVSLSVEDCPAAGLVDGVSTGADRKLTFAACGATSRSDRKPAATTAAVMTPGEGHDEKPVPASNPAATAGKAVRKGAARAAGPSRAARTAHVLLAPVGVKKEKQEKQPQLQEPLQGRTTPGDGAMVSMGSKRKRSTGVEVLGGEQAVLSPSVSGAERDTGGGAADDTVMDAVVKGGEGRQEPGQLPPAAPPPLRPVKDETEPDSAIGPSWTRSSRTQVRQGPPRPPHPISPCDLPYAAPPPPVTAPAPSQRPQRIRVAPKTLLEVTEAAPVTQRRRSGRGADPKLDVPPPPPPPPSAGTAGDQTPEEQVVFPEGLHITKKPRSTRKGPRPSAAANAAAAAMIAAALASVKLSTRSMASLVAAGDLGIGDGGGAAAGREGASPGKSAGCRQFAATGATVGGAGAPSTTPGSTAVVAGKDQAGTAKSKGSEPGKAHGAKGGAAGAKAPAVGLSAGNSSVPATGGTHNPTPAVSAKATTAKNAATGGNSKALASTAKVKAAAVANTNTIHAAQTAGTTTSLSQHPAAAPPLSASSKDAGVGSFAPSELTGELEGAISDGAMAASGGGASTAGPSSTPAAAAAAASTSPNGAIRIRLGRVAHPAALAPAGGSKLATSNSACTAGHLTAPVLPATGGEGAGRALKPALPAVGASAGVTSSTRVKPSASGGSAGRSHAGVETSGRPVEGEGGIAAVAQSAPQRPQRTSSAAGTAAGTTVSLRSLMAGAKRRVKSESAGGRPSADGSPPPVAVGKRQKMTHSRTTSSRTTVRSSAVGATGSLAASGAAARGGSAAMAAMDTASSPVERAGPGVTAPYAGTTAGPHVGAWGAPAATIEPTGNGPMSAAPPAEVAVDDTAGGVSGGTSCLHAGDATPAGPLARASMAGAHVATLYIPQSGAAPSSVQSSAALTSHPPLSLELRIVPSPAAATSSALLSALGSAALEEPTSQLLRILPLTYIHKARIAAASSAPPPDASGGSGASGSKSVRPGCLAAWVLGATGGGGGGAGGGSGTSFDPEPPAPVNPYVAPGKAHHNTSLTYINDQTQCDMQYIYCSILRIYKPAVASAAALVARRQAALKPLAVPYMAAAIQMLKDTKYFVKNYGGGTAQAAAAGTAADGRLRLLVALELDEEQPPAAAATAAATQHRHGSRGGGGGGGRTCPATAVALASVAATAAAAPPPRIRRQLALTPPEVVVVDTGAAAVTLVDLKCAVLAAFSDTYRMFCPPVSGSGGGGMVTVTSVRVINGSDEQALPDNDSTPLRPPLTEPPAASGPPPPLVVVRCSGLDPDRRWRHAGGPEDWRVACLCGTQDDDGERMIACDVCGVWSHTRCNDIPDDEDEPPAFVCQACAKTTVTGGSGGGGGKGSRDCNGVSGEDAG